MRKSKYNSFDELPLMLTVEDVSHVLGIGLAHAYEEWIDEQATKKSEIL